MMNEAATRSYRSTNHYKFIHQKSTHQLYPFYMRKNQPAVTVKDVEYSYREAGQKHSILHGLNAEFAAERFSVIQGRSGSGKSTVLNLIAGIDLPDSGSILVAGQDMTAMHEQPRTELRRRQIGLVFQFFNLIPTLTVAENVRLPMELIGTKSDVAHHHALELLASQGLGDRGDSFPEQLSGGEQQRVAVLRAIAHRPAVLLADEPTGNLDRENENNVLDLICSLPKQYGCAVIAVTHSDEVAERADQRYELIGGRLLTL